MKREGCYAYGPLSQVSITHYMPYLDRAYAKVQTKPIGLNMVEESAVDKGTFLLCEENNFNVFVTLLVVSLPL